MQPPCDEPAGASTSRTRARQARIRSWLGSGYAVAMAVLLFYPFDFYNPVRREPNGARRIEGSRGIQLTSNGIVCSSLAPTWLHRSLVSSPGLTLEAWVAPSDVSQVGPARIVTYSQDKFFRNFTLAQDLDALVFRLRTTKTDRQGQPETVVDNVFSSLDPVHLAVTYDFATTTIYVDGETRARLPTPGGRFDNWNADFGFALGNELTGNRPWRGKLYLVAIYGRALSAEEIRSNAAADPLDPEHPAPLVGIVALHTFSEENGRVLHDLSGSSNPLDLIIPESVLIRNKSFLNPPDQYTDHSSSDFKRLADIVINIALFLPFGYLLYTGLRPSFRAPIVLAAIVVLLSVSVSVGVEIVQYFVRHRVSSWGDVLHNAVGTVLGLASAYRLRGRDRRRHYSSPDPASRRTA